MAKNQSTTWSRLMENCKHIKTKVSSYARINRDHLVITKMQKNISIHETDIKFFESTIFDGKTIGTKQDYFEYYSDKPLCENSGRLGISTSIANTQQYLPIR